ncbi:MAG: DsbA family protein [bacterium]
MLLAGFALLGVACVTSGMLVFERLAGLHLPGCGIGSPCAQAAASAWGKVPGVGWPVSYLGFAYFLAMLVAWGATRGALAGDSRAVMLVRAGAAASLLFTVVLFVEGHFCIYCLVTHAANLLFWFVVERAHAGATRATRGRAPGGAGALKGGPWANPLAMTAGVFAGVTLLLGVADVWQKSDAAKNAAAQLEQSTQRIIDAEAARARDAARDAANTPDAATTGANADTSRTTMGAQAGPDAGTGTSTGAGAGAGTPDAPTNLAATSTGSTGDATPATTEPTPPPPVTPAATTKDRTPPARRGFTGRFYQGPDVAPMRVVIISDYQCEDCKRIEGEMKQIFATRTDVSLSAKHFPMCSDCNLHARKNNFNPHPNACWAARAAETAGMLRGNAGFWKMHEWLFARDGSFTDAELYAYLGEEKYDAEEFRALMMGDETLRRVQADIDEAMTLGLQQTPMVFVNGIELVGTQTPGGLARSLANVAATKPVARDAAADKPPNAAEKIVNDWRKSPVRAFAPDTRAWELGSPDGAVQVVVWGDLQEPRSAEADGIIRGLLRSMPNVGYTYRHYPINQECNPVAARTLHDQTCAASKLAEAAGTIAGADGFWKMQDWLFRNQKSWSGGKTLDDATIMGAARACGLEHDEILPAMTTADVGNAITEDARAGKAIGLTGVPTIFVNGKQMRVWREDGETIMRMVLEAAAK